MIDADVWAPRDDRERCRIYTVTGGHQRLIATCDVASLGLTLVTLREEEQIDGYVAVGILDGVHGRWLVNPYAKTGR